MQEVMSHLCTGDQPALPKAAVLAGATSLLNTMGVEDVMGDAPKAADWVSKVAVVVPACMSLCAVWTCMSLWPCMSLCVNYQACLL